MIDCHAHLVDNKFKNDIDEVIERAKKAGVVQVITVPEFPSQFDAVMELHKKYPDFIVPALGLHPIRKNNKGVNWEELSALEEYLEKYKDVVKCIGEVGLDYTTDRYHLTEENMQTMRNVLKREVEVAKKYDLALNVHSRSAWADTVNLLIDCGAEKVSLHAFGGPLVDVKRAVDHGFYFSIPPSFSVEGHPSGVPLVENVPLEQLLLETDSPVLGQVKGERNEPANIVHSVQLIAKVKQISVEEVVEVTSRNARKLFSL